MGLRVVSLGYVRTIARVSGFRGRYVLHTHCRWSFCLALPAAGHGTTLSSMGLSTAARNLSVACFIHRSAIVALQAAVHLARIAHNFRPGAAFLLLPLQSPERLEYRRGCK
jgi:hypothetical protein